MIGAAVGTELVERLRAVGEQRYHDKHPFHRKLVAGELDARALRAWVANRYYYQISIPRKDAYVLASLPSRDYRRAWLSRITDHDGLGSKPSHRR